MSSYENEVYKFLERIDKEDFYDTFKDYGYNTFESMQYITLNDLKGDMGIPVGHARVIFAKWSDFNETKSSSVRILFSFLFF